MSGENFRFLLMEVCSPSSISGFKKLLVASSYGNPIFRKLVFSLINLFLFSPLGNSVAQNYMVLKYFHNALLTCNATALYFLSCLDWFLEEGWKKLFRSSKMVSIAVHLTLALAILALQPDARDDVLLDFKSEDFVLYGADSPSRVLPLSATKQF